MTRKDFATIAVRILALYTLVQALPMLGWMMHNTFQYLDNLFHGRLEKAEIFLPMLDPQLLAFTILIATSAILWGMAEAIATRIVRACAANPEVLSGPTGSFDQHGAMVVGSVLVGLYLLVHSIPSIVLEVGWLLHREQPLAAPRRPMVYMVAYLIQFVISLWLILGARGLVALIGRFRTAGNKSPQ
jgi:hypothetical protein